MQYIRTKTGVYEVLRKSETNKSYITAKSGFVIHKDNVIKQADNLEELFDEFVYKKEKISIDINKKEPYLSYALIEIDDSTPFYTRRLVRLEELTEPVFGAIWTDKGLIFKAKMKGVLPNGEIDWELL